MMRNRAYHTNMVIGRLKEGVSVGQAQSDLDAIAGRLEQQYPNTNTGRGVGVFPILEDAVREYKTAMLMIMATVAFVLLIACANVANLTLARATGRMKEVALRLALGASRGRVIRQLLTESVILALIGGTIGVLLAGWGVEAFKATLPEEAAWMMPGYNHLGVNSRVLIFTLIVAVVTGILFGLAPAIQVSKPDLNEMLKDGVGRFALILAATGIYGVMAYAVSQRTREIGVRMALGAKRGDILKLLVVGQGMWMAAIGIIIGLAGSVGLAQVLKSILFGVNAIEWSICAGVTLLLAFVSLLACYIPERRATKVDPMVALRYE
jgi:ABC-type antimicrobial peptide transport system permease subunit